MIAFMNSAVCDGRHVPVYQSQQGTAVAANRRRRVAVCSLTRRSEDAEIAKTPVSMRDTLRLGIPSKGRMAEETLGLLNTCQLKCVKPNPRQYFGQIPQFPEMEVWFQRASDVVRKLRTCDLDLGIVGMDMFAEFAAEDKDLVVVHDALSFGQCKLALGIPNSGEFLDINTIDELRDMGWTSERPLRCVTAYINIAERFFEQAGFEHVSLRTADGALEAAPAMGAADIILDLVSTGVTLRENNLKESEGVLVANRRSLLEREGLLKIVHELLERLEAHLVADQFYRVTCNVRTGDPDEFAAAMHAKGLGGMEGPTISQVKGREDVPIETMPDVLCVLTLSLARVYGQTEVGHAACICVHKKKLYDTVKVLRQMGGSGVLVSPMTYIFDEEPQRWTQLLEELELKSDPLKAH